MGCALLFDEGGVYFFYYGDYITQHTMIEIIEVLQLPNSATSSVALVVITLFIILF